MKKRTRVNSLKKNDYKTWLACGHAIENYVETGRVITVIAKEFRVNTRTLNACINSYFGRKCKPVQMCFNTEILDFENLKIIS